MAEYHQRMARYSAPGAPKRYRQKFRGDPLRRLSAWREQRILQQLLERFGPHASTLDCACGPGRILPELRGAAPRVFAMDLSGPMAHEAADAAPYARCLVGDACLMPFGTDSVDLAVCMRLIHHFDPEGVAKILGEAARVARKGVLVSFSDADTWKFRHSGSRRRGLTREQLAAIASDAGLTMETPVARVGGAFSFVALAYLRVH